MEDNITSYENDCIMNQILVEKLKVNHLVRNKML